MKTVLTICILITLSGELSAQQDTKSTRLLAMFDSKVVSPDDIWNKSLFRQGSGVRVLEYFEHLGVWHLEYDVQMMGELSL